VLTEPLPSNKGGIYFTEQFLVTIGGIHIQTHRLMDGIVDYAAEMGSVVRSHKNWCRHSKVDEGGGYTDIERG
jgi:hypothetical protein